MYESAIPLPLFLSPKTNIYRNEKGLILKDIAANLTEFDLYGKKKYFSS